jgi:two-component system, OmpR family, sensor kinase
VSITVRDEGPGLAPDDAERVFERFFRVDRSRSRSGNHDRAGSTDHGGAGLGLSIVQALVKESEGEIHIDTGPRQGTTVAVTLPRLDEHSLAEAHT